MQQRDTEYVYVFDRLDQNGLDLLRRAASSQRLTPAMNGSTGSAIAGLEDSAANFVPFRFAAGANASSHWKSLLRTDCWSKLLYKCPVKSCIVSLPNNYVDGFNGPTKIGTLTYKGAQVLLLADFHGSEDNMCDRSSRGLSRSTTGSKEKKPRMEEWVNKFVAAGSECVHCPVVDVVLEAMDAELETGAPYPLDKAVSHFSPCLEKRRTPGRCGKHRYHKIDIRHGTRFPSIGDFEVVIDSFYGRSSSSASRSRSIEVWQRIFNDLQPLYNGTMNASQVVQRILSREPQLLAQLDHIRDQEERQKLLRWVTTKVGDMPRNFLNIEASLPHVLSLYDSSLSYADFAKKAEGLRARPMSSLMHAALFLSVLIVDFYALSCMLSHYSDTDSKPTHVVAYVGFHHFDNYVDYFDTDTEIVGRSGSEQRCETCASLPQPFLAPRHSTSNITLMIPRSFALTVLQASSQQSGAAQQLQSFAPVFDTDVAEARAAQPMFNLPAFPSYGNIDILSYARPSRQLASASSSSTSSAKRDKGHGHETKRHKQKKKSRTSRRDKRRSSRRHKRSKSSSSSSSSHEETARFIPRAQSPLPYTLRVLSRQPSQRATSSSAVASATLFRQAYPHLF